MHCLKLTLSYVYKKTGICLLHKKTRNNLNDHQNIDNKYLCSKYYTEVKMNELELYTSTQINLKNLLSAKQFIQYIHNYK